MSTCLLRRLVKNFTNGNLKVLHFRYTSVPSTNGLNEKYGKNSNGQNKSYPFDLSWFLGVTVGASLCGYIYHNKLYAISETFSPEKSKMIFFMPIKCALIKFF